MTTYKLLQNGWLVRGDGTFINPEYQEYLDWLKAGNTPSPADPPPAPIDYSDINNMEKAFKALALCIAQVGGLTVVQMKTLFQQKWQGLP